MLSPIPFSTSYIVRIFHSTMLFCSSSFLPVAFTTVITFFTQSITDYSFNPYFCSCGDLCIASCFNDILGKSGLPKPISTLSLLLSHSNWFGNRFETAIAFLWFPNFTLFLYWWTHKVYLFLVSLSMSFILPFNDWIDYFIIISITVIYSHQSNYLYKQHCPYFHPSNFQLEYSSMKLIR
jgi:hypothetical protein